jgi:serine/threonine-protein kinase
VPVSSAISERSDPLVGLSFYDFVIERKLAQGGMGAVYLLRHQRYPIRKVLKVILSQYADHPAIRERFEREALAVASLKHPNIAKIDSVGTINGQPCMLIPFLEGQPLDAYLAARGGQLRPHEVLHVATQIARALHYAHGEGVIHRDLKPGNVFVEPTEDDPLAIQVLDFGIAKQLKNSEPSFGTSGPLGTPEYMAVEQFEHASDVTPAADIWALATVVWEMCTGRRPWSAPNAFSLYHKQLHEPPEPPAAGSLSPAWELTLRKALSPNPRMRPQSMPALVVPLAHALPANPPDEPSGVEVLRRDAPKWLEEMAAGPSTAPIASPPLSVPTWSPGIEQGTAPVASQTATSLERSTVTGQPAGAPPFPGVRGPAMSTTLGSAAGVMAPRSSTTPRWKLALLGGAAAVLSAVVIVTISSLGGHRDAANGAPAAPIRGASAPEASSTTPSIAPVQSETRPSAPLPPPAALASDPSSISAAPAVPSPSAHHALPGGEPPTVQGAKLQPSQPSSTPRMDSTAQPTPPTGRGAGKPTARAKSPANEVAPGFAKPPTASGSHGEQPRPDPPEGNDGFDPNAVGGREKK